MASYSPGVGVSSVTNSDGTLLISPTTGSVVASLNLNNANTWTAAQTYGAGLLEATSPKITTNIEDANGNAIIAFTATTSAVNQITVANAAASGTPSITATGNDTNIDLKLAGKGTGAVAFTNGGMKQLLPNGAHYVFFTIGAAAPPGDQTLTFPGVTATIPGVDIVNTWTGVQTFNNGTLKLAGSTSGTTILEASATASGTITLPAVTDTVAVLGTAQTFTAVQTFGNNISFGGAQLSVTSLTTNDLLQFNGTNWVNVSPSTLGVNVKEIANASETELTTTAATDIVSVTPSAQGNFLVYAYYRVVTGATTLTLDVTWTDSTGAQTNTIVNAISQATGSYSVVPVYVNATTGSAIKVTATAGTANQVYCSASVIQIS